MVIEHLLLSQRLLLYEVITHVLRHQENGLFIPTSRFGFYHSSKRFKSCSFLGSIGGMFNGDSYRINTHE